MDACVPLCGAHATRNTLLWEASAFHRDSRPQLCGRGGSAARTLRTWNRTYFFPPDPDRALVAAALSARAANEPAATWPLPARAVTLWMREASACVIGLRRAGAGAADLVADLAMFCHLSKVGLSLRQRQRNEQYPTRLQRSSAPVPKKIKNVRAATGASVGGSRRGESRRLKASGRGRQFAHCGTTCQHRRLLNKNYIRTPENHKGILPAVRRSRRINRVAIRTSQFAIR
jgi:hypothetical protein